MWIHKNKKPRKFETNTNYNYALTYLPIKRRSTYVLDDITKTTVTLSIISKFTEDQFSSLTMQCSVVSINNSTLVCTTVLC